MSDEKSPHIVENENGPLSARHIDTMVGSDGAEIDTKPNMSLCRCGRSKDKPFCDGTHREAGFLSRSEKEPSGKDKLYQFEGNGVTVHYNPRVCSHAAQCIARAPDAFDPDRRPWIKPENADPAVIEAAVRACPSGALMLETKGDAQQLLPGRAQITVEKNGPYWVEGASIDVDLPGEGATRDKYVLCRCGLSGNKPYCDGSHAGANWKDDNS
ncbi:CDGSH iron-sulfur domain-containing protein [Maribius pontilimi]|uniref:CDGSH iron-sulfur domain-containing protein n=1 Tax=Palleronia pontilimi TaxID=1964209 RepID=A0A934MBD0_9RHOB|nr:CDGSH iron-sulfur domain-containing protein [Palleronia pontilimi]MBJ3761583.1 CDGSH iron-sulfur domain-containing protein [Palleronia pontilimi]